ncbi:hypothetical protein LENED_007530 [Lentinula edodes]|uniref:Uncharacterized protein n=1 Tax=Lentinula edodes TaxID=5353 RepID=A0A1Q3EEQ9_LENED|nr:hypothetical protein LENED_007530 [Lentinula edodes]
MSNRNKLETRNSDTNTVNETASLTPDAKETILNNFEVHSEIPTVIKYDPGLQTGREALQNLLDAKDAESVHAPLHVQYPPSLEQKTSSEEVQSAKMKASGGKGSVAEKTAEFLVLKDSEHQVENKYLPNDEENFQTFNQFSRPHKNLAWTQVMKPNSSKAENAALEQSLKTEVSASKSAQKRFQTKRMKTRRDEKTAEQQTPETKIITSSPVEERFEAKCTELGMVQKEKAVIEKSMDGTRIGLNIMKQELDELQSRHADLQSLFGTARNDSSKKMRDKDIEIESLSKEKAAAEQLLEAKILALEEAEKEFEKKNAESKATREEEKAAVEQALEAKNHALKAVEKKFEVKCTELSELQQENAALSESIQRVL